MADPFLQGHLAYFRVFEIGRRTPISIRDQLLRAQYLVPRLFEHGFLRPGAQMLVVGAGAGGAAAAILAARRGAFVRLIDAGPAPFALQSACGSRSIDPVQYDWPAHHCGSARWPVSGPLASVPLGFRADSAPNVARAWRQRLNLERLARRVSFRVDYRARLMNMPVPTAVGGRWLVTATVAAAAGTTAAAYDAVILARGLPVENTEVPNHAGTPAPSYVGLKFWQPDRFAAADFGLPGMSGLVLVSGSGDGALQDYIRLVTGSAYAIDVLAAVVAASATAGAALARLCARLEGAEHEAQRSLAWNEVQHDHAVLARLHDVHRAVLHEFEASHAGEWAAVMSALRSLTAGREPQRLRLVHGCVHFSACYALNRFVTLLLARFIELEHKVQTIESGWGVAAVRPPISGAAATHACVAGCWGQAHEVDLTPMPRCGTQRSALRRRVFDGVVIRHGFDKRSPLLPGTRQLLPFHLP